MHTISLEEALVLFQLPRTLGDLDGVPLTVGVGRFGPFVKHGSTYASLGKEDDPYTIDFERVKALLIAKAEAIANRILKAFEGNPIQVLNGRYGPTLSDGSLTATITKDRHTTSLTLAESEQIGR